MNAATFLLGYAVIMSWLVPKLMMRVQSGVHPRLAIASWLAVIATTTSAWIVSSVVLVVGLTRSVVTDTAVTFCIETLGLTRTSVIPPQVAVFVVFVLIAVTTAVIVHTARVVCTSLAKMRRSNHEHVEAVRLVGHHAVLPGVVVISAEQATAYCVADGGRNAVVVTTAALDLLEPEGLAAVLAHEHAHLKGRHHLIVAVLSALASALPRVPLMRAATKAVPTLLEMSADRAAAARYGRGPVVESLVALSTGHKIPAGALGATGASVVDRVSCLMSPPRKGIWRTQLRMTVVVFAVCAIPTAALALCGW